jgi:hypothetical protein
MAVSARAMLEQFVDWDIGQLRPNLVMLQPLDLPVLSHLLALRRDLVYLHDDGTFTIRQLWTDGAIDTDESVSLALAAHYLHGEIEFGEGRIRNVEAWHLRRQLQYDRDAPSIQDTQRLQTALDQVASQLQAGLDA